MRIAVVGARDTPSYINNLIYSTIKYVAELTDVVWISGGCDQGPDRVMTEYLKRDPRAKHELYLPTVSRQRKFLRVYGELNTVVVVGDYKNDARYSSVVRGLHPAPERLSDYVWSLHGRNLNVVAGISLDQPVDLIIYSGERLANGGVKGGTGMAIAYADTLRIPSYNFKYAEEVGEFYSTMSTL